MSAIPAVVGRELGADFILRQRPVHLAVDEADSLLAILSHAHLNAAGLTHEAGQKLMIDGGVFHTQTIDENAYESKRKAL